MSATLPATSGAAPPEREASRWKRGTRRKPNPSGAIVARGEPLVWLSGSALVMTLAMIVGLTLLILCVGGSTFWPRAIVRLSLKDGSAAMGEVASVEQYRNAPGKGASASDTSEDSDAAPRRRQIRIGNFELTGAHYRWINDADIAEDGESLPEWALLLERVEQGHFYGIPKRLILHHPRSVSGDEEQLVRLLTFFETNAATVPESVQADLHVALERVRSQVAAFRKESFESLRQQIANRTGNGGIEAAMEDGSAVSLDAASDAPVVVELREIVTATDDLWARFQKEHAGAERLRRQQEAIRRQKIGTAARDEEDQRLELKSMGMAAGLDLPAIASEKRAIDDELQSFDGAWNEQQQFGHQARRRFGVDSPITRAADEILRSLQAEHEAARSDAAERAKRWTARLETLPEEAREAVREFLEVQRRCATQIASAQAEIQGLDAEMRQAELEMETASGEVKSLRPTEIVRAVPANRLSTGGKLAVYLSRWREFLWEDPREANTEGGVFPAIWGTVTMTLIMSLAVVPFGVLAALYLREYAKAGIIVSAVRIAVNNLAGVPSIVFGVFGLGFFCYIFGAYVDGGPANAGFAQWPARIWTTRALLLAGLSAGAFALGLWSVTSRRAEATAWKRWMGRLSLALWLTCGGLLIALLAHSPYFQGLHSANLPNPTYGKGGVLWASLTLALMTLPVVIVATEEALAAVPNSMREGSYACGASKWQTIQRIVLPRALPGIMTGMILAMARGAGEVAPLMLVGAVKNVPELPMDLEFPFLHPERSFMHLGFHIFDLGFQSPNSEAAKPMVFTTTLLLIVLIGVLNLAAIWLRSRLRQRYKSAQF